MRTIGVIGVGMVGGTLLKWFLGAKAYDKYKEGFQTLNEVVKQDIIFICVWLDENGRSEKDKETLDEIISQIPDGKVVVIKSTVVPGTTDYFQDKYPQKLFVFNPEFLTELTAQYDFEHPCAQILGCTSQSLKVATELMEMLPKSDIRAIISPKDAEMYKHIRNVYLATKVIIFNQFYDACETLGAHYDTLRGIFVQDKWIAATHTEIWHKGYRGYGGKCLPKETRHLIAEVQGRGGTLPLFEEIEKLNSIYLNEKIT